MREQRPDAAVSPLTHEEIEYLRALIVRQRTQEAERWLLQRGFAPVAMKRIMLAYETPLVNTVKEKPWLDIGLVAGGLLCALLLGLTALDASKNNASFNAASGLDEFIYIIEAFIGAFTAYFLVRCVSRFIRYRSARKKYPLREDVIREQSRALTAEDRHQAL